MNTLQIIVRNIDETAQEILIAELGEIGFDAFEQAEHSLVACIPEANFDIDAFKNCIGEFEYSSNIVQPKNWNEEWEKNFEPVFIGDFCTIRADFHDLKVTTPYEIVITPKMSFGTGHHSTTQLVMMLMKKDKFEGKKVLDFGTGTGVLAIFAEMLGATDILGIDNDDWCVENGNENLERNNCKHTKIEKIVTNSLPVGPYDTILANINRHILLDFMEQMHEQTMSGGKIIMSGLLEDDFEIIQNAATGAGLKFIEKQSLNGWIAISYSK